MLISVGFTGKTEVSPGPSSVSSVSGCETPWPAHSRGREAPGAGLVQAFPRGTRTARSQSEASTGC